MAWDAYLVDLKYLLLESFDENKEIRAIIKEAGLSAGDFDLEGKPTNIWTEVLDQVNKRGKIDELLDGAIRRRPENESLKSARNGLFKPIKRLADNPLDYDKPLDPSVLEVKTGNEETLLDVDWLEQGANRARSVAKVEFSDITYGSGFLLQNNLFLTNNHVIKDKESAKSATLLFNYQKSLAGREYQPVPVSLDPDTTFITCVKDDWTVVKVKGDANKEWGYIELNPVTTKVKEHANIIQHPAGGPKQVAFYHNLIAYADDKRVQYLTDTLPGSSGSPVFDNNWRLIALHHAGGTLIDPGNKQYYYRNEGIAVSCLIQGLSENGIRF